MYVFQVINRIFDEENKGDWAHKNALNKKWTGLYTAKPFLQVVEFMQAQLKYPYSSLIPRQLFLLCVEN